jgi:hypothetical protein
MSTPAKPITPTSAPPSAPLTPEERKRRFVELRQRMGRSQIEVTPPAGKYPYFAPKNDTREIGRLQWLGFSIVHDDPKNPVWVANGMQSDGTYVINDVILMEIDEEIWDMIQQEYRDLNESQRSNAASQFMAEAEKQGAPTFEVGPNRQPGPLRGRR